MKILNKWTSSKTTFSKAFTRLWKDNAESTGQWSWPRPPKAVVNHSVDFMKTNAKSVLNLITVNSREATAAADAGGRGAR